MRRPDFFNTSLSFQRTSLQGQRPRVPDGTATAALLTRRPGVAHRAAARPARRVTAPKTPGECSADREDYAARQALSSDLQSRSRFNGTPRFDSGGVSWRVGAAASGCQRLEEWHDDPRCVKPPPPHRTGEIVAR